MERDQYYYTGRTKTNDSKKVYRYGTEEVIKRIYNNYSSD